MSEPHRPAPAKLFVSIFAPEESLIDKALERLESVLGPHDLKGPLLPFNQTDYYEPEFGSNLVRRFISFERLIEQEAIVPIKHLAWKIEKEMSHEGKRRVNIDPGYILLERLVLVTFKNFSHRLYLGQGVYGEVTLIFRKGRFEALPWTYPDYASPEAHEVFMKMRARYKEGLKAWRARDALR